jgi:hypothetical protein
MPPPTEGLSILTLIDQIRPPRADVAENAEIVEGGRGRRRSITGGVLTFAAVLLVYLTLVVPDAVAKIKTGTWVPGAFLRVPIEGILGGAVLLAAPARWRRRAALLLGLGLGLVGVLKIVNMGFRTVLGRRFNAVLDWPLFRDGYNAVTETDGRTVADAAVVGAVLLAIVVLTLVTLAVLRLAKVTVRHAGPARRGLVGLSAVWLALALSGITLFPNSPVASGTSADLVKSTIKEIPAALRDQRQFAAASRNDPFGDVPAADLLAGLQGKDVVIGVVESYGRSALENPQMSAIVDPALRSGEKKLAAAGYAAKSGFLTASTYGGGSWMAHASFQSGLWINSQQRYRQLTASDRRTLASTFHDGGWQTVGVEPGNTVAWPEASFYGYESVLDSRNIGYRGPRFGWSRMPDQFTLSAFQREIYGKPHKPMMAEITLTSSHEPWTPVPEMIDWDKVGDGQVYGPMARGGESRNKLWSDPAKTKIEYAKSIGYSVDSLTSWAQKYGDKNLVLIMFGDHQPMSIVSGQNASHDVPVTVIAHDPAVLDRIAGWGWQDGLRPSPSAPVWRMDEFRDRFFTAFGKQHASTLSAPR